MIECRSKEFHAESNIVHHWITCELWCLGVIVIEQTSLTKNDMKYFQLLSQTIDKLSSQYSNVFRFKRYSDHIIPTNFIPYDEHKITIKFKHSNLAFDLLKFTNFSEINNFLFVTVIDFYLIFLFAFDKCVESCGIWLLVKRHFWLHLLKHQSRRSKGAPKTRTVHDNLFYDANVFIMF